MVETLRRARFGAARAMTVVTGLAGVALLALLGLNVASRLVDINLIWIAESARIVFVWGMALGMIAVSLGGQHFRVDVFNLAAAEGAEPNDLWEIVTQLLICGVLAYILTFAIPSIARAGTQVFAAVPLSYGTMRLALAVGLGGMLVAHAWRLIELVLLRLTPQPKSQVE